MTPKYKRGDIVTHKGDEGEVIRVLKSFTPIQYKVQFPKDWGYFGEDELTPVSSTTKQYAVVTLHDTTNGIGMRYEDVDPFDTVEDAETWIRENTIKGISAHTILPIYVTVKDTE